MTLMRFYDVSTDFLLGLAESKNHPNADLSELHLSDTMIELLKSGKINTRLLCEMAAHKDFVRLLAGIEIYVDGIATMQIQNLNAWVNVARAEIIERYHPDEQDKDAYLLQAIHIHEHQYFCQRVHEDIDRIMGDIKVTHRKPPLRRN